MCASFDNVAFAYLESENDHFLYITEHSECTDQGPTAKVNGEINIKYIGLHFLANSERCKLLMGSKEIPLAFLPTRTLHPLSWDFSHSFLYNVRNILKEQLAVSCRSFFPFLLSFV